MPKYFSIWAFQKFDFINFHFHIFTLLKGDIFSAFSSTPCISNYSSTSSSSTSTLISWEIATVPFIWSFFITIEMTQFVPCCFEANNCYFFKTLTITLIAMTAFNYFFKKFLRVLLVASHIPKKRAKKCPCIKIFKISIISWCLNWIIDWVYSCFGMKKKHLDKI